MMLFSFLTDSMGNCTHSQVRCPDSNYSTVYMALNIVLCGEYVANFVLYYDKINVSQWVPKKCFKH